jgi:hypothetical protein
MRLLDAEALIYDNVADLIDFPDESSAPPYAILSHTWEEEEILFHDIPLGPQHEIQATVASVRARRRQQALFGRNPHISSCEEAEVDWSDEDSCDTTTSDSLLDYAEANMNFSNRIRPQPPLLKGNS